MSPKFVAVILSVVLCAGLADAELIDEIVATVGPEIILRSEVMEVIGAEVEALRRNTASQQAMNNEVRRLFSQALEEAVQSKLLLREALLAGLEIGDNTVEDGLNDIRAGFPSTEAFMRYINEVGETLSDVRARLRKRYLAMAMDRTKRRQLKEQVVVSEADVVRYYEVHRDEFQHPERVRCSQIFLSAPRDVAQREAVKARADALRGELGAGADFSTLAIAHSEAPGAKLGGLIGWVERGDLKEELETAAFALDAGVPSAVLETANGFHIVLVTEREAAGMTSIKDARSAIEPLVRTELADKRYQKWISELWTRSHVQILI